MLPWESTDMSRTPGTPSVTRSYTRRVSVSTGLRALMSLLHWGEEEVPEKNSHLERSMTLSAGTRARYRLTGSSTFPEKESRQLLSRP